MSIFSAVRIAGSCSLRMVEWMMEAKAAPTRSWYCGAEPSRPVMKCVLRTEPSSSACSRIIVMLSTRSR